MTDHTTLKMHKEEVRIAEKEMLKMILDMTEVCSIGFHDEPYPYVVPVNYGYEWEDQLVFYSHMANEGHKVDLIRQDPRVCVSVPVFLERLGSMDYQNESHDFRSVTAYGRAQILDPVNDKEEFLHGFSVFCRHTGRGDVTQITPVMHEKLYILKITCGIVSGKAQYPVRTMDEVPMPPLRKIGDE